MFVNSANINKKILNLLKSFKLKYKLFDSEGNYSSNLDEIKYIFVEDLNSMIILKEPSEPNKLIVYSSNFGEIKNKKNFYKELKNISNYFNIIFSLKNFGKKIQTKEFSSLNENNSINTKNNKFYGDLSMDIEEGRKKKGVDFEVTPEIKKWAEFLRKIDNFSGGFSDRVGSSEEGEDISDSELLSQAKRLVKKEIKKFPGAKELEPQTMFSKDKKIANAQKLHDFYSQVSQYLDPDKDSIIGNIVSRLSDHYLYLATGQTPTMSHGSSNFKAVERLSDEIAKMVGLKKPILESKNSCKSDIEELFDWFNTFDPDLLFINERRQALLAEKAKLKLKINEAKKNLIAKRNKLIENKEKLYNLALNVGRNYSDEYKLNELTKILSEKQKEKVLNIIKETFNEKIYNKVKTFLV